MSKTQRFGMIPRVFPEKVNDASLIPPEFRKRQTGVGGFEGKEDLGGRGTDSMRDSILGISTISGIDTTFGLSFNVRMG